MTGVRQIEIAGEVWPIRGSFAISRGAKTEAQVVVVTIRQGEAVGRGEAVPYQRYGESVDGVVAQLETVTAALAEGMDRAALQAALPAGAARNAVDCALWDLEAKLAGRPVWQLAGLAQPRPLVTAYSLSLDTPRRMAEAARAVRRRPLLKLKLGGDSQDMQRVWDVHAAAPGARLIVDANEAMTIDRLAAQAPMLSELGVVLIEQPLPAADDGALAGLACPVALAADESCHTSADLPRLAGKYRVVNLKLDKTGGLTEALAMRRAAEAAGFGVMVGCMMATSLAMAPAVLLAQGADFVDLDGPLWLERDRTPGLEFGDATIGVPGPDLWG